MGVREWGTGFEGGDGEVPQQLSEETDDFEADCLHELVIGSFMFLLNETRSRDFVEQLHGPVAQPHARLALASLKSRDDSAGPLPSDGFCEHQQHVTGLSNDLLAVEDQGGRQVQQLFGAFNGEIAVFFKVRQKLHTQQIIVSIIVKAEYVSALASVER